MMLVAPFPVGMTTASMNALVAVANFTNSNTPTGLENISDDRTGNMDI